MSSSDEDELSSASDPESGSEQERISNAQERPCRPKKTKTQKTLDALRRKELLTEKILALVSKPSKGPTMTTVPPPGFGKLNDDLSANSDIKHAAGKEPGTKDNGNVSHDMVVVYFNFSVTSCNGQRE